MTQTTAPNCNTCHAPIEDDLVAVAVTVTLRGRVLEESYRYHYSCWEQEATRPTIALDNLPVIDTAGLIAQRMRHTLSDGSPWGGPTLDLDLALAQVPARAAAALRWHYSTIDELAAAPTEDLHAIKHVGPETVGALRACITIYQAQRKARG